MKLLTEDTTVDTGALPSFLPYNLLTQHSIPDKSVADCVESLIGAYLVSCGPKGALVFMSWLGIKVRWRFYGCGRGAAVCTSKNMGLLNFMAIISMRDY